MLLHTQGQYRDIILQKHVCWSSSSSSLRLCCTQTLSPWKKGAKITTWGTSHSLCWKDFRTSLALPTTPFSSTIWLPNMAGWRLTCGARRHMWEKPGDLRTVGGKFNIPSSSCLLMNFYSFRKAFLLQQEDSTEHVMLWDTPVYYDVLRVALVCCNTLKHPCCAGRSNTGIPSHFTKFFYSCSGSTQLSIAAHAACASAGVFGTFEGFLC